MAKHRADTTALEVFKRGFDSRYKDPDYGYGMRRSDECEHGLSPSLCEGPQHYYMDEEELAHAGF